MNTITIRQASAVYPVHVGRGLLDGVGSLVRAMGRVFVITSSALRDRFGERVAASFRDAVVLTMEEGEAHKTLETANDLVTQLLDCGAKRDSLAVVVGGGVVGDTAGFAAAIFLRGIDLVHVPTTLLAQVDSSLGGKVAVNHPKGKNLIGAFHPPRAVIADLSVLDSLPERERLSGLFEALKGGVIGDSQLFALLETPPDFDVEQVVLRAIRVKADIVSADVASNANTLTAVVRVAKLANPDPQSPLGQAWAVYFLAPRNPDDAIRAWKPAPLPPLSAEDVLSATEHDKKNTGSARIMVLPQQIGRCAVTEVTEEEIRFGISALGL